MSAKRVPDYAEWPNYGVYPCDNEFHSTPRPLVPRRCPECGNRWWATDGSECPEEYALIAEIDELRAAVREPETE